MKSKWSAILGVAVLTAALAGQSAFGQGGAGAKQKGQYNFWEAQGWQHHAQNQARSLYNYSQTPQPTADQAQEHATAARKGVTSAQKSLAELKKSNPDNKEAQAAIAKIEEIQKKVLSHCEMCDKAIAKDDHTGMAACCADIFHDLEAANAEMKKLQKALKISDPELPKK
ncbi:MAG: hypothetical protein JST16_17180 [Bdellovibrionales bacterium]|nr:hypothetical protein [Bdellovibrionales bacterium]